MPKIQNIEQIENIFENRGFSSEDKWDFYNFWSKVDIKDNTKECWNWLCHTNWGYGQFHLSTINKPIRSSRIAYILSKGAIPDKKIVMHNCNNPTCCNPNHLILGDQSENMQYMIECGRADRKGENSPFAELTEDQVREIHNIYKENEFTQKEIGGMFGVDQGCISLILNGKRWCNIYKEMREI